MKYQNRRIAPSLRYFEGNLFGLTEMFHSSVLLTVTRLYAFIETHQIYIFNKTMLLLKLPKKNNVHIKPFNTDS